MLEPVELVQAVPWGRLIVGAILAMISSAIAYLLRTRTETNNKVLVIDEQMKSLREVVRGLEVDSHEFEANTKSKMADIRLETSQQINQLHDLIKSLTDSVTREAMLTRESLGDLKASIAEISGYLKKDR